MVCKDAILHKIIWEDMSKIYFDNQDINWGKLKNSTILVTGANGMIASYFIYMLLFLNRTIKLNVHVVGLVRNKEKAVRHFDKLTNSKEFSLLIQDVCAPIEYNGNIDFIIHAASSTTPGSFRDKPVETIKTNILGTMYILEYARVKKVREVMYLSTREIYGTRTDEKEFVKEFEYGVVNPSEVRSCYPESKRLAENMLMSYHHEYGIPIKISRIAHTYGPGMPIGDGRVVSDFLQDVLNSHDITLNSDGSTVLALTYLSDTIAGIFRYLLNMDELVCNISSNRCILSVKKLAELLCDIFPERQMSVSFKTISISEKKGYLKNKIPFLAPDLMYSAGWNPMVSVEIGMKRTIAYLEK